MKTAALMIGAILVILLMPATLLSIDDFRMADFQNEYNVATGAGENTTSVTLSQELYGDETRNAIVTSNVTADAPIASSYTSSSRALLVTGLAASESRRLTVDYQIDALEDYWGAGLGSRVWPLFLILGVLGIVAGAVYNATRKGD